MDNFDVRSYIGVWHELALIPQPYELACDSAMAIYSLTEKGINIQNLCLRDGKIIDSICGKGVMEDGPSKLFITFENGARGTYWVHATDYKYFSIVGNKEGDALWILSRNQVYSPEYKQMMKRICLGLGLDIQNLVWR